MRKIRDPDLLDRLEEWPRQPFAATVWRITRAGRDPLIASAPKGRWDDGSFNVLYTALQADTARAELHWHLTRGQPVYPSGLLLHLHEMKVSLERVAVFTSVDELAQFGAVPERYGTLDYASRQREYSITQQMGEAAAFLGLEGLVVPSARASGRNHVIITGNAPPDAISHVKDHGPQDLKAWASAPQRT